LFEGDNLADIIGRVLDVISKRHIDSEKVKHVSFRELELESDQPLYVHVDAEPVPFKNNSIQIKVIPKYLKLLVPKDTPMELFSEDNASREN
jgi:diacylglycerol kinase family enzyme